MPKKEKNLTKKETVQDNVKEVVDESVIYKEEVPDELIDKYGNFEVAISEKEKINLNGLLSIIPSERNQFEEIVEGQKEEVFKVDYKKGKNAVTAIFRDKATVATLTNIDKIITLYNASATLIVKEMSQLKIEEIKKSGDFENVLNFLKTAFSDKLSANTIERYYKVAKIFYNTDGTPRLGVEYSITNLDTATRLLNLKERKIEIGKLSNDECKALCTELYTKYIQPDELHLNKSLSALRQEIDDIKSTINPSKKKSQNDAETSQNGAETSQNGADSTEVQNSTEASQNGSENTGDSTGVSAGENKGLSEEKDNSLFEKIRESVAIFRSLITDDAIMEQFNNVVAHIADKFTT